MIIVITYKDNNTLMVSHGYNVTTDELVILPCVPLVYLNAKFDFEVGEYILNSF